MKIKVIAGIMLTLFLVGMLTMTFDVNAQSAHWEQVNIDGFGDPNNVGTTPTVIFEGNLYAGTANFVTGTEVWRSPNGTNWTQVNTDGFGDPTNAGACTKIIFQNMLYVGTWKLAGGAEMWRTFDGENWTQVNADGFGDSSNVWVYPSEVFNGYLYAGTENFVTGGEVWRSSNGTTWTQVNVDGFGDPDNIWALDPRIFEGNIYVGTRNDITGGQVWRSSDGTTWTQVNTDGFGNSNNVGVYPIWPSDDRLYVGTDNYVSGTEIWSSSDGTTWTQANVGGFGDPNNFAIAGSGKPCAGFLEGYDCGVRHHCDKHVGTWNEVTGAEVWRRTGDSTWTQLNVDGFGDRNNYAAFVEVIFNNKLYVGTGNDNTGGEIWRLSPTVELPTITSITPDHGNQGETLDVIITGTNFDGATEVIFGAQITVNSFNVDSSTQITANISIDQMCEHRPTTIFVTTPTGTATLEDSFTVGLKKGCFVATAAYGTPAAEDIEILREFRDEYLLTNAVGRALTDLYYKVSQPMAQFITEHSVLKPIVRAGLVPAVAMSAIAVNTTAAEKAAIAGLLVLVSVAVAVLATRRRGRGSEYT